MRFIILICFCFLSFFLWAQVFEPTYFSASAISTDLGVGAGAMLWCEAKNPNGATDFNGYGLVSILEENPNGSAYMVGATGFPTETLYFDNSSGWGVIIDNEPEMLSVVVYDPNGAIKSTLSIPFNFVLSGSVPVKLRATGPKRFPAGGAEGPFFYSVEPVDALGNPVPSYYTMLFIPDAVRVRVIFEEYPGTVQINSIFSGTVGNNVTCPAFYKTAYFTLRSDSAQFAALEISDLLGVLAPDTFQVEFVKFGEVMLLSFPISGVARTVGNELPVAGILFGVGFDGPYPYNDTTVVFPRLVDLHGTFSATVSPNAPQTLRSGIAAYEVSDTEPDTVGVFIKIDTHQDNIYVPMWTPLRFNPPGKATMLWLSFQPVAVVNDTVEATISVVDDNFNLDEDWNAYVSLSFGEGSYWPGFSFTINDTPWIYCAETENGILTAGITSFVPGTASIVARDCEESGIFEFAYVRESPALQLTFVEGGTTPAVNYTFYQASQYSVYPVGKWCTFSIAAISPTSTIDVNYSGTATISITGSAEISPSSGVITFSRGIANFEVKNDVVESVQISCTGDLLSPSPLTIYFSSPDEGGIAGIVSFDPRPIAGAEFNAVVLVMNYLGYSTYDGTAMLSVDDPNMNGSVTFPSAVPINAGIGPFSMVNTDAEVAVVTASIPGFQSTSVPIKTFAILSPELPTDTLPINVPDTFYIFARRADGPVCSNLSWEVLSIFLEEEIPNGSAFALPDTVTMWDGVAGVILRDTEPEYVWIWINTLSWETFLTSLNEDYEPAYGWRFGPIYFGDVGVCDNKPRRSVWVGPVFPTPFNSKASVSIDMPHPGSVSVEISDILGRKVAETEFELPSGIHRLNLPLDEHMSSGAYWVKVVVCGKEFIRKTVMVK